MHMGTRPVFFEFLIVVKLHNTAPVFLYILWIPLKILDKIFKVMV